ncbi:phosphate propanoyltransferase [Inediibacterium massiliense]|uniref:phosphate propanoyltransferase n=1 Tax=Inediibacterium massiliense TaxID=1658111 RepID=UPI0006B5E775|nr:phosphate propanoyltransferase [Inediibacterium massiliense]
MQDQLVQKIVKQVIEKLQQKKDIPVEVSARHVHLSQEHMKILFKDELKKKKDLSQPGQFQYEERVTLIGPKGVMKGVSILGPARDKTQVEISKADARTLGVNPPVRESGKLDSSDSIYIATDQAVMKAEESVIVAQRHIHMNKEDAKNFGVEDRQLVSVRVKGERPIIFEDVLIRVSEKYHLSMHIDVDEANALGYKNGINGEIMR